MMLMMLAPLTSIISIIGIPFLLLPGFCAACAHWARPDGVGSKVNDGITYVLADFMLLLGDLRGGFQVQSSACSWGGLTLSFGFLLMGGSMLFNLKLGS